VAVLSESGAILARIFQGLHRVAPVDVRFLKLNVVGLGPGTDFFFEVTDSSGSSTSLSLQRPVASDCATLRKSMYQPGTGTWYSAHFTIDAQGVCEVNYDYDSMPVDPNFDETLADIRDELIDDQKLFPRDQEHLPAWHPSRK
jgi:hypothetical protein